MWWRGSRCWLAVRLSGAISTSGVDIALVPASTLVLFLVFFLLGYLLFAALYGALGSLVSRTEDVNSITGPLTIVMVGVYLVSISALGNPDADYIRWLSFVPFFTPMLMFIRVALSNPPIWEIASFDCPVGSSHLPLHVAGSQDLQDRRAHVRQTSILPRRIPHAENNLIS